MMKNASARENFEKCMEELNKMAKKIFYSSYSYYCVMKMSKNTKKLARLTTNEAFLTNFKENLNRFPYYEENLLEILETAYQTTSH